MAGYGPVHFAAVAVLLLAATLAGCGGSSGFVAHVKNRSDQAWAVTVTLVASGNGTEAYNRTFDVPADESVRLPGFPPYTANFTAHGRLDDGRTTDTSLSPRQFCSACSVHLTVWEDRFSFGTAVT